MCFGIIIQTWSIFRIDQSFLGKRFERPWSRRQVKPQKLGEDFHLSSLACREHRFSSSVLPWIFWSFMMPRLGPEGFLWWPLAVCCENCRDWNLWVVIFVVRPEVRSFGWFPFERYYRPGNWANLWATSTNSGRQHHHTKNPRPISDQWTRGVYLFGHSRG